MSVGLIALLDDVAAIAKVAAASLDDVAAQATKAGAKAAGIVIDDAAITPRFVAGFAADRELPIIRRIAMGSLRNKLLILLPAALVLSFLAPWAITPLLMIGGAFLCYEGVEKLWHAIAPEAAHAHEAELPSIALDAQAFEDEKVAGAIKTDFILSAEIMAITLATVADRSLFTQMAVLAAVGLGLTVAVYGAVAVIVKADDAGVALARAKGAGALTRAFGRGLVVAMPYLLKTLGVVGTAAMIWVGGGIVVHGFESYGLGFVAHAIEGAAHAVEAVAPILPGLFGWLAEAVGSGLVGIAVGAAVIPLTARVIAPVWGVIRERLRVFRGA